MNLSGSASSFASRSAKGALISRSALIPNRSATATALISDGVDLPVIQN